MSELAPVTPAVASELEKCSHTFPWLPRLLWEQRLSDITRSIKVERVDAGLGARHLRFLQVSKITLDVSIYLCDLRKRMFREYERLLILDEMGDVLGRVGYVPKTRFVWLPWGKCLQFDPEDTLAKALRRLGPRARKAYFVFSCMPIGPRSDFYPEEGFDHVIPEALVGMNITIFKRPKDGRSIAEFFAA